jgi:hypothetical protein
MMNCLMVRIKSNLSVTQIDIGMLNIKKALESVRMMRALTGLDGLAFKKLLITFELVLQKESGKPTKSRKRAPGGGRHHTLDTAQSKLFYILFYMKCYPTFDLAGFFFDVDRSQTNRWVKELLPLLEQSLGRELVLPKRKITSLEDFLLFFPSVKDIFIDGTERPVQRPEKNKRQTKHYSGKKKRHTKKNLVVSTEKKEILILTPTKSGKQHDMQMLKKSELPENIPKQVATWVDMGFQGLEKFTGSSVVIPHKKSKNNPLTAEQKQDNQIISGIRICNEQAIGGIKRLRCTSDILRNRSDKLADDLMFMAAGIWNFHLKVA